MKALINALLMVCCAALGGLAPLPACVAQEGAAYAAEEQDAGESDEKKQPPVPVKFARESLVLPVPGEWNRVRPRSRIIELEFEAPPEKRDGEQQGEVAPGRVTVTVSGGGVEGNIARWIGQFRDIEPTEDGEKAKIEHKEVAGMPLRLVDISGTFLDSPRGPFGPKTEKPDHRMLGAILPTRDAGMYFFKFVGPQPVVEDNAEAFREMLMGIKAHSK